MTKKIDKVKMPIAIEEFSKLNFDSQHISTSNFFDLNIANCIEMVPRQKITIRHNVFTRLEPMPLPTFGIASVKTKAFFVPFRTVMPGWNDFIEDVAHSYASTQSGGDRIEHINSVHTIYNSTLVTLLMDSELSTVTTMGSNDTPPDFVVTRSSGSTYSKIGYVFTPFGRKVYRILRSLGYAVNFSLVNNDTLQHSAMPILCLLRAYLDWYFPSVYSQDATYMSFERLLKYDSDLPFCDKYMYISTWKKVFQFISRVSYDSDYFVSSWDNPVGPNQGTYSDITINDITQPGADSSIGVNQTNGTPVSSTGVVTQFMVNALKGLSDYMARHRLAGARVLDRYLSRFGVVLDSAKLDRSIWFGESTTQLSFGDVTSTADTEGAELGSYSGKGIANGDGSYSYETDEYGMLLLITTIIPKTSYYQQRNRHTQHLTKLDFYTPEFDNLGVQALPVSEVFMPTDSRLMYPSDSVNDNDFIRDYKTEEQVFSFVPRYGEYKIAQDLITGDYVLNSRNAGKDGWTLFRDLRPYFAENGFNQRHDLSFIQSLDADQFNRIFYYTGNDADHFNISHLFNIENIFPGKRLYDTYEFDTEGKAQNVIMDNGGVKAN